MDKRQKRSRKVICEALLQLMKDKPIEQITIKELTDFADVNRKTFYNNFNSIIDVRKEMESQIVDVFFNLVDAEDIESKIALAELHPQKFVHKMLKVIGDDRAKAKLVFETGETTNLLRHMRALLEPCMNTLATEHNVSKSELEYTLHYVGSGTVSVLNAWLHEEYPISSMEMEKLLTNFISNTFRG